MRGIRGRGREVSRQAEVARGCPPALQTIDDASCALEGGDERGRRASYDRGAPERGGRGLVEAGRADRLGGAARRRTARGMTRQRSIGASSARADRPRRDVAGVVYPFRPWNAAKREATRARADATRPAARTSSRSMRSIRASARGVDRIEEGDGRRSAPARSAPVRPRVSPAIRPESGERLCERFVSRRSRAVPENDAREARGEERTGGRRRWRERRRARAPRWTR